MNERDCAERFLAERLGVSMLPLVQREVLPFLWGPTRQECYTQARDAAKVLTWKYVLLKMDVSGVSLRSWARVMRTGDKDKRELRMVHRFKFQKLNSIRLVHGLPPCFRYLEILDFHSLDFEDVL